MKSSIPWLWVAWSLIASPAAAAPDSVLLTLKPGSWYQHPNTKMAAVCAPWAGYGGKCKNVIAAWSGGAYDKKRARLVVWGGGHGDYYGNELYAFDVRQMTWRRLTDPSPTFKTHKNQIQSTCMDPLPDGQPNARHTYNGLAYLIHTDRFWAYGGSLSCGGGNGSSVTWTFDFSKLAWENRKPRGPRPNGSAGYSTSFYDPTSKLVFHHDNHYLFSYDYDKNVWTKLSGYFYDKIDTSMALDPQRGWLLIVGSKTQYYYDVGKKNYVRQDLKSSGGSALVDSQGPGLAYDSKAKQIVGYAAGSVFRFDASRRQWTKVATTGKAPTAAGKIYGRWRYLPSYNVFVLVTGINEDVYFFKHSSGGKLPPPAPDAGVIIDASIADAGAADVQARDVAAALVDGMSAKDATSNGEGPAGDRRAAADDSGCGCQAARGGDMGALMLFLLVGLTRPWGRRRT